MHSKLGEDVVGIAQDIHEVGDGGALVSANIGDTRLEEGFGDGQDAFAMELFARGDA